MLSQLAASPGEGGEKVAPDGRAQKATGDRGVRCASRAAGNEKRVSMLAQAGPHAGQVCGLEEKRRTISKHSKDDNEKEEERHTRC